MLCFRIPSVVVQHVALFFLGAFILLFPLRSSAQNDSEAGAYELLVRDYQTALSQKDTLKIIDLLIDLSDVDRFKGDYDLAFDNLWEAWLLSEKKNHDAFLVPVHRGLGVLYDIYNKDSLALEHLHKALKLSKELDAKNAIKKSQVVSNYYSIGTFWRDREEYKKALVYFDSCGMVYNYPRKSPYVLTDRGYCNLQLGNMDLAEKYLFESKPLLEKVNSPYVVGNLSFIGDFKKKQLDYDAALNYYNQSLELLESRKVHFEMKPNLLEKIGEIHIIKGDYLKGVNYIRASKKSFENLFGATNTRNQRLFEIKNKYKTQLVDNEKALTDQRSQIEQKNRDFFLLVLAFATTLILGLGIYFFVRQRNKIKKLSLVSKLEKDKSDAVLSVKSKELTTYTLKIIEMEEAIQTILNSLKEKQPNDYKKLKAKYLKRNKNSWDEFNKRFTEVNVNFYENLCKKHPDLSATELKHCALIKLNFNSYEMSKILHISLRSVHTSRYRIRKKFGLDSNLNLTSYIGSI